MPMPDTQPDDSDKFDDRAAILDDCGAVVVFVCTSCDEACHDNGKGNGESRGALLYRQLAVLGAECNSVDIVPVDCLAVCDRSVTVAFVAPGKWTYIVGGIDPERDGEDVFAVAQDVAASSHGVLAMEQRPPFFRSGVIARVPPARFRPEV